MIGAVRGRVRRRSGRRTARSCCGGGLAFTGVHGPTRSGSVDAGTGSPPTPANRSPVDWTAAWPVTAPVAAVAQRAVRCWATVVQVADPVDQPARIGLRRSEPRRHRTERPAPYASRSGSGPPSTRSSAPDLVAETGTGHETAPGTRRYGGAGTAPARAARRIDRAGTGTTCRPLMPAVPRPVPPAPTPRYPVRTAVPVPGTRRGWATSWATRWATRWTDVSQWPVAELRSVAAGRRCPGAGPVPGPRSGSSWAPLRSRRSRRGPARRARSLDEITALRQAIAGAADGPARNHPDGTQRRQSTTPTGVQQLAGRAHDRADRPPQDASRWSADGRPRVGQGRAVARVDGQADPWAT